MVGIIGAMRDEVDGLVEKLQNQTCKIVGGVSFFSGTLGGKKAVVAQSGIGKVNASMAVSLMLANFPDVSAVISTGVAGGIGRGLKQGDIVIASACVQHDFIHNSPDFPLGLVAGFESVEFPSDPHLLEIAEKTLVEQKITFYKGIIATGDEFIKNRQKSEWLRDTFGAIACDMESCALSQVCCRMGVRFLSIRSISDSGDDTADVDFNEFLIKATQISVLCTTSFIKELD